MSGARYDVIVVGAGNAALCAALAACEEGARVLVLERAPRAERGGNSAYTDGKMRTVYRGLEDLLALAPDLTPEEMARSDFGTYTEDQFFDDLARITEHRADPDLAEILVKESHPTLRWLKAQGVRFLPNYGRQAYRVGGRFRFWGGAPIVVWGGGAGLVEALFGACEKKGIEVLYGAWARELVHSEGAVTGVRARVGGAMRTFAAAAVVLACGGFEANAEWRARYLGAGWDLAKVRGTRYNTGDGLAMALALDAQPYGHWSGCHAVGWERNASDFGDPVRTPNYQRHSYTFGIMVNAEGRRFVDEGADFRSYTYAKYGHEVLRQPGQFAWQVYDSKVRHLLLDEYRSRHVTRVVADTVEELAERMGDVDKRQFLKTVQEFNAAVRIDIPFDPNVRDGRCAAGLEVPRSNWANRIDTPPFEAYAITCGITFTFGGLRIDTAGRVLDAHHEPIRGLFAAGEMVGGIFYFNYPGASGLTSGAVFGRRAGRGAARFALGRRGP